MKKLQLHVEVIHNGGEMILALEDNIPEADARRRLKKAQSDPRAFPRLAVDEVDARDPGLPLLREERRRRDDRAVLEGEGLRVVRSHHERWDGRGYPDELSGSEIPVGARIFAVADALDAMTSHRPYRRAIRWTGARDEILAESGKQFDPEVVEAFRERESELRAVRRELAAA